MKVIYNSGSINKGLPVSDSNGYQVVNCVIRDGSDIILLIYDALYDTHYICKAKSYFGMILEIKSEDFDRVEDDDAWESYKGFFESIGVLKNERQ